MWIWGASLADKGFSSISQWLSSPKSHMWSLWFNVAPAHLCEVPAAGFALESVKYECEDSGAEGMGSL